MYSFAGYGAQLLRKHPGETIIFQYTHGIDDENLKICYSGNSFYILMERLRKSASLADARYARCMN